MAKFYDQGGVQISDGAMQKEFDTRPTFDLSGQLRLMNRAGATSEVDGWFSRIGDFMKASGSIQDAPSTASYITDDYLKMVANDPKLAEFANRTK